MSGPITIEHMPPKSLFKTSSSEVLETSSATYFCLTAAPVTCISEGTGSANPLAGVIQVFDPEAAVSAIEAAESQVAAHVSGYNVAFSSQSFGGIEATCVTLTSVSDTGKYCVTKKGVLAYNGTATESFQLSSYSTAVSDRDFLLPAGAEVKPLP